MAKNVSSYEADAKEMVERIEAARAAGEQLTFLPDEVAPADSDRAKRGKGKATTQLREYLAAKGMRLPEDVLVQMAGLASSDDAFVTAMARTEQILSWAEAGGRQVGYVMNKEGALVEKELDNRHTTAQRLAAFQFVYTAQLRAAEALLPYGLAKVTPDVAVTMPVRIVMPAAQAGQDRAATARDITPQPRRMAPPPMPHEMQQNQGLGNQASGHSDGVIRTEGAKL
jgi:hypothetical protein